MKGNSILLTASMLLLTPALIAAEKRAIQFGGEIQGHMINDAWHSKAGATTRHLDTLTAAVTNSSGFAYQKSGDQPNNYTFGGRLTAQATISDGFSVLFALGLEEGMGAAKGFRPLDSGTDGSLVLTTEWDAQLTTGVATWKNNVVIAPAVFFGTCPLKFGIQYDMREFVVSGHETQNASYLDGTFKDNQILFGVRSEKIYDMDGKHMTFSFEFMTNFGRTADGDMKTYFTNLAAYGFDIQLSTNGSTGIMEAGTAATKAGGILAGTGTVTTSTTRAKVTSVNTNLTKASLGLGFMFTEF